MSRKHGFSLVEMLVSTLMFSVLAGAVFGLLAATQRRAKVEADFLDSFQSARVAMDLMIRDIHSAGYPPTNVFTAAAAAANPTLIANPFVWAPNYPTTACVMGSTCTSPTNYDIILETNVDPQNGTSVEWVRYRLNGTTLERGVTTKTTGDAVTATAAVMQTFIENVMNNPGSTEIAAIQAAYPTMFPSGAVRMFVYTFDTGPQEASNIRQVDISLIVRSASLDPVSRQMRLVGMSGQARRQNPRR